MEHDSLFELGPEQLDRLLSIGSEEDGPAETKEDDAAVSANNSDGLRPTASLAGVIEQPGGWIGRYRLLDIVGEGGMGIVYLAEQTEPIRRRVALKVIKPGMDSKHVIARFEAERQTLALLDHPNIAHVHDAGTTEAGRPYFVMEYVEGLPITDHCDKHKLRIEQRLRLFLQVCDAVQHAHQKGIIHRDIKPSNILVAAEGDKAIPKIIDFGIAKAIAAPLTECTLATADSRLLGTPEYMSPEQADMAEKDIDTRSDVYSLGMLLYELLTGVLPFDAPTLGEGGIEQVRKTIRETDPKTPSTRLARLGEQARQVADNRQTQATALAKRLHKELEWIPLKALRKERAERYRSVSELADDVENYLKGNPLIAGPLGKVYRAKKFIRRHKPWAIGIAAVLGVLIAGTVVSTVFYIMARQQAEIYRRSLYVRNTNLAYRYYLENNLGRVRDLLKACPEDLREWEWYYLWRVSNQSQMTFRGHKGKVGAVAFSPDGKRIVSAGADNRLQVWDADTGEQWRTLSGTAPIAFSPDGNWVVSGSGGNTLKLWDAESGAALGAFAGHEAGCYSVAFSPDGRQIVSGGEDKAVRVWDINSGEALRTFQGHERSVTSVVFSPDGRRVVSGSIDGTLKVWNAKNGNILKTIYGHGVGQIYSVAFNPNGTRIVFGGFSAPVRVLDANDYSELMTLEGGGGCRSIAFSPDGRRIAAGSVTATFRVWDAISGREPMLLKGHTGSVWSVAFSPDGQRIVSGSEDETVKVWDLNRIGHEMTLRGHEGPVLSVASGPEGRRIVSGGGDDTTLKLWDAVSGRLLMTLRGHTHTVRSVAFGPHGQRIVSGSQDGTIKVWNLNRISDPMTLQGPAGALNPVAFGPDGTCVVSGSGDDSTTLTLWDAVSGSVLMTLRGHTASVTSVAFSPDGERIVSGSEDGIIKVWDVGRRRELRTLEGHKGWVVCVAFSPNGKRIVSGSWDKTLKVWDADSASEPRTLTGHDKRVNSAAFSPDGKRIVSGSDDNTLKVWNAESGDELATLRGHTDYVRSVAFSPDGRRIVSAGAWDRTIKIWDIASREEVESELLTEKKGVTWIRKGVSE
ncbi:MAG: serine/threonine protein kinase [Sedimentisphaerales bacterium]|nr:serine/threonine protein kinase [Sedimentisphaerales bacterium]